MQWLTPRICSPTPCGRGPRTSRRHAVGRPPAGQLQLDVTEPGAPQLNAGRRLMPSGPHPVRSRPCSKRTPRSLTPCGPPLCGPTPCSRPLCSSRRHATGRHSAGRLAQPNFGRSDHIRPAPSSPTADQPTPQRQTLRQQPPAAGPPTNPPPDSQTPAARPNAANRPAVALGCRRRRGIPPPRTKVRAEFLVRPSQVRSLLLEVDDRGRQPVIIVPWRRPSVGDEVHVPGPAYPAGRRPCRRDDRAARPADRPASR